MSYLRPTLGFEYLIPSDLYAANQDPEFAGDNLGAGYVTTVPGARATLFYGGSIRPLLLTTMRSYWNDPSTKRQR